MKSFPLLGVVALAACTQPVPGPMLLAVEPPRVSVFASTPVTLSGAEINSAVGADLDHPSQTRFSLGLKVTLLNGTDAIPLLDPVRVSPTRVTAVVPSQLNLGLYTVLLQTELGESRLANALEVAECFNDCTGDGGTSDAGDVDGGGLDFDGGFVGRTDTVGPGTHDWRTVSVAGTGQVWIAGRNHVEVMRDGGGFTEVGNNCPNLLLSSWAAPSTGFAWLGGQNTNGQSNNGPGQLTGHALASGSCGSAQNLNGQVLGLQGFALPDGGLRVFGVLDDGHVLEHQPSGQFTQSAGFSDVYRASAHDLQGFSPASLFAAGSSGNPERPSLWRVPIDGGTPVEEGVISLSLPDRRLNAVWAVNDTLAYAVGSQGALLERTPTGWHALPSANRALLSVRAFGPGHVYATSSDGRVMFFDGTRWQVIYRNRNGTPLTDIAATAEDDIWVVGYAGVVLHRGP